MIMSLLLRYIEIDRTNKLVNKNTATNNLRALYDISYLPLIGCLTILEDNYLFVILDVTTIKKHSC